MTSENSSHTSNREIKKDNEINSSGSSSGSTKTPTLVVSILGKVLEVGFFYYHFQNCSFKHEHCTEQNLFFHFTVCQTRLTPRRTGHTVHIVRLSRRCYIFPHRKIQ